MGDGPTTATDTSGDTGYTDASGALAAALEGGLGPITREAQAHAEKIIEQYEKGAYTAGEDDLMKQYQEVTGRAAQALRDARERLAGTQYDPAQGNLLAAQALMQGNRSGSTWEGIGNAFGALAGARNRAQEFELGKQRELANYDLQIPQQDERLLDAKLRLQQMHEQMAGPIVRSALQMLGRTPPGSQGALKETDNGDGTKTMWRIMPDNTRQKVMTYGAGDAPDPEAAQRIRNYQWYPSAYQMRDKRMQSTVQLAMSLPGPDPFYQQGRFAAVQNALKSWLGSGTDAQVMTRVGTAIGHMNQIDKWIDQLNNGDISFVNAARNWWKSHMEGQAPPDVIEMMNQLVAAEVIASINARGGGEEERLMLAQHTNKNRSPQILHQVVQQERGLQGSRVMNMMGRYKNETFRDDFMDHVVATGEAREAIRKLQRDMDASTVTPLSDEQIIDQWRHNPQGSPRPTVGGSSLAGGGQ